MQSPKREPFAELFGDLSERLLGDRWQPALDVIETQTAIVVRLEMSGVRSRDIAVSVDGEELRIRGVRRPPATGDALRLHQSEIAYGPFERVLRLRLPFVREGIAAHLEEGFLTVTLPKGERRTIDVGSE